MKRERKTERRLYAAMLSDERFVNLPDRLWRRYVELQLFLTEVNRTTGHLDDIGPAAQAFGLSKDDLLWDMAGLLTKGLLTRSEETWSLLDPSKEQARD